MVFKNTYVVVRFEGIGGKSLSSGEVRLFNGKSHDNQSDQNGDLQTNQ